MSSSITPDLEIEGIFAGYGELEILHDVSLHVEPGEIVALIGSNGAGKTTLMKTVAGLLKVRGGEIRARGEKITSMGPEQTGARGIRLVPEGRHVFAGMTVEENLRVGGRSLSAATAKKRLLEMYERFPILSERARQDAQSLSGGQQQLLVVARALMSDPKIILLDEPSLGLAPLMVSAVFEAVAAQRELGVSVLLVEQNVQAALELADRGYVIESGRIVRMDHADELLADPTLSRSFLGAS